MPGWSRTSSRSARPRSAISLCAGQVWVNFSSLRPCHNGCDCEFVGRQRTAAPGWGNEQFPLGGEGVLIELVQAPPEVVAALG